MGCFGGGGDNNTSSKADKTSAAITQEQWADYTQRFIPLENEMIAYADSGQSVLSGAEGTTTPDLGEEIQQWEYSTPDTEDYTGKSKWKKKLARKQQQIANMEASGKTGGKKYKKRLKKLNNLKSKVAAHTTVTPGQTFSGEQTTLAGQLMKADQYNASAAAAQHGQGLRDAARYGGMTDAQRQFYERKSKLSTSKNRMTLRNATRDAARDRDMAVSQQMMGVGRGLANAGASGASAAAGLEANRNAQTLQNSAAKRGSTMSTLGTVAGFAAMAFMSKRETKKDIESCQLDDQIAKLNSMKLYEFEYKNEYPGVKFYGPMVEEVPDEFKVGDELNPYNLISTLIATVQQLQARVDELENK